MPKEKRIQLLPPLKKYLKNLVHGLDLLPWIIMLVVMPPRFTSLDSSANILVGKYKLAEQKKFKDRITLNRLDWECKWNELFWSGIGLISFSFCFETMGFILSPWIIKKTSRKSLGIRCN